MKSSDATALVEDDRLKKLSFTGSSEVGWAIKARAGKKPVTLELGGDAAVVIDADADIADAVKRVVFGAFYQSGQSCIGVQRIYVHEDVYDSFSQQLVAATKELVVGDPKDEATFIGPVITDEDARRMVAWVHEAVNAGAKLLCGGTCDGRMVQPTLLENVPPNATLAKEEVFGPVAHLQRFTDFDAVLDALNASRYGLQAGVFTRDIYKAYKAWDRLEVGGVMINEVPSWRVDHMPYGGVKDSGLGREGIRFAMEHMTERRLMVLREV